MSRTVRGEGRVYSKRRRQNHRVRAKWTKRNAVRLRTLYVEVQAYDSDPDLEVHRKAR